MNGASRMDKKLTDTDKKLYCRLSAVWVQMYLKKLIMKEYLQVMIELVRHPVVIIAAGIKWDGVRNVILRDVGAGLQIVIIPGLVGCIPVHCGHLQLGFVVQLLIVERFFIVSS